MTKRTVAIYGSHDANTSFHDGQSYRSLELEKFTGKRYCSLSKKVVSDPAATEAEVRSYYKYIKDTFSIDTIDTLLHCEFYEQDKPLLEEYFKVHSYKQFDHHMAHAAGAFAQSPYEKALVVSFDGGGVGLSGKVEVFCVYIADRNSIYKIGEVDLNLGVPYERLGVPLKEIRKGSMHSYAGKMMGLAAYGEYDERLYLPMQQYYLTHQLGYFQHVIPNILGTDTVEGQESNNLAFMSQKVFEDFFDRTFGPIQAEHPDLPVVFTGGAALNVLNNQIWYEKLNGRLFVPPNPNDCGLAFGALMEHDKPQGIIDMTYSGFDILDLKNMKGTSVTPEFIAKELAKGKIIGLIKGLGEIGPRALGNRSILCDPSIPGMKDTLNAKVKFREAFRPFAPIVRLQDVNKYFEFTGESRFMNFCPKIRDEYRNKLGAIVHKDNTARVQTIIQSQHPYLFSLLSAMESIGKEPVLLNTSFNIKGKSIITKISEAFEILNTTELDGVLVEGQFYTGK